MCRGGFCGEPSECPVVTEAEQLHQKCHYFTAFGFYTFNKHLWGFPASIAGAIMGFHTSYSKQDYMWRILAKINIGYWFAKEKPLCIWKGVVRVTSTPYTCTGMRYSRSTSSRPNYVCVRGFWAHDGSQVTIEASKGDRIDGKVLVKIWGPVASGVHKVHPEKEISASDSLFLQLWIILYILSGLLFFFYLSMIDEWLSSFISIWLLIILFKIYLYIQLFHNKNN